MENSWIFVIDVIILSLLIVFASILKARVPALRKLIIPTSMIAGFTGLLLGPEMLGLLPFDIHMLGDLVYHLMAVGFIALSLKERDVQHSPGVLNSGLIIVSTYLVQGILGLTVMLLLTMIVFPDMFPGVGLLLPLGFGQGPGQAYSIGTQWEELGLTGGGNLGLTIAGLGFVWATVVGIIIMNVLIRSKKFRPTVHHQVKRDPVVEQSQPGEIPLADAIDKLTYQVALIGLIYLITYLTIVGISNVLQPLGTFAQTFAQLLVGFHFLIGSVYAMLFRWILNKWKQAGLRLEHEPNNFLLQRISGLAFDYMIAASIAAISIYALQEYLLPVILLTTIGGLMTIGFITWIIPRVFPQDKVPNILGFYGMLTGTISTGLALVKAVDPEFRSNTTDNLVVGSVPAILFGAPLLLILNIPIFGYVQVQPIMYVYTLLILIAYFALLLGAVLYRTRKQKKNAS